MCTGSGWAFRHLAQQLGHDHYGFRTGGRGSITVAPFCPTFDPSPSGIFCHGISTVFFPPWPVCRQERGKISGESGPSDPADLQYHRSAAMGFVVLRYDIIRLLFGITTCRPGYGDDRLCPALFIVLAFLPTGDSDSPAGLFTP